MKLYPIVLFLFVVVTILTISLFTSDLKAANNSGGMVKIIPHYRTNGTVNFQVLTVTNHGTYTPRNIGAIWVTTESGTFVKTLQRWGNSYLQFLTKWHSFTASGNVTGAITGATKSNHTAVHNLNWNCTNTSNVEVPDGNYKIWVEYTESNGTGPNTFVTFTKGAGTQHVTPANLNYFHDLLLDFTPTIVISAPSNLQSTFTAPNNVNLSWSAPSAPYGMTSYKVYRDNVLVMMITPATTTTYTDNPSSGTHSYYVTAVFGTTESAQSNTITVDATPIIVGPPLGLEAIISSPNNVNLTWSAPTSITGLTLYKVYRDGTMIISVTPPITSYADTPSLGDHSYYVTAMFGETESNASNIVPVTITANQDDVELPGMTTLKGNYPNPFNPETNISFSLAKSQEVRLSIYNFKGQKVKDLTKGNMTAGLHVVSWNGTDDHGNIVASGIYFCKLETNHQTFMKKMIMLK